ncbi:pyridoxal-phosphate-dependent aminotransferase family protein [Paenibacillus arenilitoris]|uniref:Alanine--glyoxylate aminotransferase family protein n=1 Tax=Paenibacillus arenilitoris TaxID=2772299 RepID=A0A927CPV7_9BACL|nr:alanine--glyoxylate aminotransferase family protein [Paenibacillus arenilitoris]MBD2871317.1 alanine--glyoxylate aminotransferase family protein [Paenibacillus arenilitoris]
MKVYKDWSPSPRTIMTPGPVEVDPRVLRTMSYPILGQFDPEFTSLMNETMAMLRELFMTENEWAFPVDGTSRSGIEAVLVGLIEPGDKVLVPIYGRFGYLLTEIAQRCGGEVVALEKEWGAVFRPAEIADAIRLHRPSLVALVHGETSTGRLQPLEGIGHVCRETGALLVVDAVATVGGVRLATDELLIDAVIGGTQKCLSVPAGMAPITYNKRAEAKLQRRKKIERGLLPEGVSADAPATLRPIQSNYLDIGQLQDYWSPARLNHHTEATSMLYALREGLRLVLEEGLEARYERHRRHEAALVAGIEAMGLTLYGDPSCKMPVVTCVEIPAGLDGESVRAMLLEQFGIEIASSFGPLKGKIWRIGTMGYSCSKRNVLLTLGALEAALIRHGCELEAGRGVQAALDVYGV